jgi:DNA-directed RNA polymerase subunit alpha
VLIAQRPTLSEEVVDEFRSRFVIEPLEPGFGYTLGNSLRRTLLSSIPGASVTSIKVDSVLHEFSTIEGVKEDVTEIILNLKGLVVSSEHDEPVTMYLRKSGAGDVTAADIAAAGRCRGPQPRAQDRHPVRQGQARDGARRRAWPWLRLRRPEQGRRTTRSAACRSTRSTRPVLKVTYKVEATRVEQRTDFDKLVIDVETKPSIKPRDAIASAGKTLVELFGLARELNVEAEGIDIGPSPVDEQLAADLALPVEDLQLTVRSYNCLKREGIHTVGELISRSEQDLLDIRNFGSKSIDEVKAKLRDGPVPQGQRARLRPAAALAAYGDDDDDAFVEDEQY